jgi:chloramphenicol O-acetyltransferase
MPFTSTLLSVLSPVFLTTHSELEELLKAHEEEMQDFIADTIEDVETEDDSGNEKEVPDETPFERFKRMYEREGNLRMPITVMVIINK